MLTRLTCMQVLLTSTSSSCNGLLKAACALEVRYSKRVEGVVGVRARRVQDVCAEPARTPSPVAWMPSHWLKEPTVTRNMQPVDSSAKQLSRDDVTAAPLAVPANDPCA